MVVIRKKGCGSDAEEEDGSNTEKGNRSDKVRVKGNRTIADLRYE